MSVIITHQQYEALVTQLRLAGCVFAEDEARLLAENSSTRSDLRSKTAQRVAGVPLEQIVGWVEFCGMRISVAPGVFVPRRRTRLLADEATSFLRHDSIILDLCCGTGALAAVLRARVPSIEVHAVDIDPVAVNCARRNIGDFGTVYAGDLFALIPQHLQGRIDLLIANAPYVPTAHIPFMPPEARIHEPLAALDGGADGLNFHHRISAEAGAWLSPNGTLLIETSEKQVSGTVDHLERNGFGTRTLHSADLDAHAVVGRRTNPTG